MPDGSNFTLTARERLAAVADSTPPRERLRLLRDFLRSGEIPEELWDYSRWSVDPECGTAGCAGGWYTLVTGRNPFTSTLGLPEELGITYEQTGRIFLDGYDSAAFRKVTPAVVADRIDEVLTEGAG